MSHKQQNQQDKHQSKDQLEFIPLGSLPLIGQSCLFVKLPDVACFLIDFGSMKANMANYVKPQMLREINFALLSHAHIDHYGNAEQLPKGLPTYMTQGTLQMVQSQETKGQQRHAHLDIKTFQFYQRFEPVDNLFVTFFPTGHFIGSAMILVESVYGKYVYSGDYKVPGLRLSQKLQNVSLYFSESSTITSYQEFNFSQLLYFQHMLTTICRGKSALHPVPSTGQGQELAVSLRQALQNLGCNAICEIVTGQMSQMTRAMEGAVKYGLDLPSGGLYYKGSFKDYAMFNQNRGLLLAAPQNIRTGVVLDVLFEQCQDPYSAIVIFGAAAPGSLNWRFLSGCGRFINRDNAKRFQELNSMVVSGQYKSHCDFRQWCRVNRFIQATNRYDIHYSEPELRERTQSLDYGLSFSTSKTLSNTIFRKRLPGIWSGTAVIQKFEDAGIVLDLFEDNIFCCGAKLMLVKNGQELELFARSKDIVRLVERILSLDPIKSDS